MIISNQHFFFSSLSKKLVPINYISLTDCLGLGSHLITKTKCKYQAGLFEVGTISAGWVGHALKRLFHTDVSNVMWSVFTPFDFRILMKVLYNLIHASLLLSYSKHPAGHFEWLFLLPGTCNTFSCMQNFNLNRIMNQLRKRNYEIGVSDTIVITPVWKSHILICNHFFFFLLLEYLLLSQTREACVTILCGS